MKPIGLWELVLGKFLGIMMLGIMALLPTLIYVWCISVLGTEPGNFDIGLIIGAYFGMVLLLTVYTAIGLFASTLSENQIVAFLIALIISLLTYLGFQAVSATLLDGSISLFIQNLGMQAHYERMGRGIIDTRDVVYFMSISVFFLFLTVTRLKQRA